MTAAYVLIDGITGMADVETGEAITELTRMLATTIGKSFVGGLVITPCAVGPIDAGCK